MEAPSLALKKLSVDASAPSQTTFGASVGDIGGGGGSGGSDALERNGVPSSSVELAAGAGSESAARAMLGGERPGSDVERRRKSIDCIA
mmetsp:Transcript_156427/g.501875  ORF Transcript_156427/g.501875 Transcript_156427/m.501875 type:complete len:89 (+) Transcript_156427:923-1189(+)